MTRLERSKYEVLVRIRGFAQANRDRFPESTLAAEAFAMVDRAVSQLEARVRLKPVAASSGRAAKVAAREELVTAMRAIAAGTRALGELAGDRRQVLRVPSQMSAAELLNRSRMFIEQAEPLSTQLLQMGLPSTFLVDLQSAVDRFATAVDGRWKGRREVAEAQRGITSALRLGFRGLRQLDAIVPNVLKGEPELLAGWHRDRRIVASGGARPHAVPGLTETHVAQPTEVASSTDDATGAKDADVTKGSDESVRQAS